MEMFQCNFADSLMLTNLQVLKLVYVCVCLFPFLSSKHFQTCLSQASERPGGTTNETPSTTGPADVTLAVVWFGLWHHTNEHP